MKKTLLLLLGILLLMSACGTNGEGASTEKVEDGSESIEDKTASSEKDDVKSVSGREILFTLEQTVDPLKRNEVAETVKESPEYKEGYFGEPTDELAEDMAVQQIEARAVDKAVEEVYGGYAELEDVGVTFLENQTSGANQSGIWIGIKDPDERVNELAAVLQEQVDTGEILAESVYIYRSAHTRAELNGLMDEVSKKVKLMAEAYSNPDAISYSISADTITGDINIGHNFLTEDQIEELKNAFEDRKVIIEQEGVMVPAPGEPTVIRSEPAMTGEQSDEGYYIINVEEERFLAVEAKSKDFSGNGGQKGFYSAIEFDFNNAGNLLEVGQRVKIETAGPILESYPGQGRAVLVDVLSTYQPESADLTEAEAVKRGLKMLDQKEFGVPAISSVTYDSQEDRWILVFKSWEHETEKIIEDEK